MFAEKKKNTPTTETSVTYIGPTFCGGLTFRTTSSTSKKVGHSDQTGTISEAPLQGSTREESE